MNDFSEIKAYYKDASAGPKGIAEIQLVNSSQRRELTVALYLAEAQQGKTGNTIHVGCSKASCYWCHIHLLILNQSASGGAASSRTSISWQEYQRLVDAEGTVGYDLCEYGILEHAGSEMQEVFNKIANRPSRRSGSYPLDDIFEEAPRERFGHHALI